MNTDRDLWLDILDKTKELIETATFHESGAEESEETIDDSKQKVVDELCAMERMLEANRHFSLALSGMTNVGKSTLLNALFGATVASTKNAPWSATAVEYMYSENGFYETVVPFAGIKHRHERFQSSEEMLKELNQFAVEESVFKTDKTLVVRMPNDLLRGDITIVDTPGFGASDGTDDNPLHDDILFDYLKKRGNNLRVFWIVKDNISDPALEFFKNHLDDLCRDLIVNITDEDYDENDKKAFEAKYRPAVGYTRRFHFVDAKTAVLAQKNHDDVKLKKSGLLELKTYFSNFSSPEKRISLVNEDLTSLFQSISDFLYLTHHCTSKWKNTVWGTLDYLLKKTDSAGLYQSFLTLKDNDHGK